MPDSDVTHEKNSLFLATTLTPQLIAKKKLPPTIISFEAVGMIKAIDRLHKIVAYSSARKTE